MKKSSKVLKIMLGCMCSLTLMVQNVPALAYSDEVYQIEQSSVQPRSPMCPVCGVGKTVSSKIYDPWVQVKTYKCKHYAFGVDCDKKRNVYTVYKCNNCSNQYSIKSVESKTFCQGSTKP